jgi:DNA-binding NarL/FixJ family response regulator
LNDSLPPAQPTANAPDGFSRLTARQLSILTMVARGLTNREIGQELHLSRYTVAQHVEEMLRRTGTVNRTDLINQAHISGILSTAVQGNLRVDCRPYTC